MMYPGENIGEMSIVVSDAANADRIADTVNNQVSRSKHDVIVFCDLTPDKVGITQKVTHCPLPVPPTILVPRQLSSELPETTE